MISAGRSDRFRLQAISAAMGAAALLFIASTAAVAWGFSPTPVCTLSHATETAEVLVTYDPDHSQPYAIAVTGSAPWPDAPVFSMRFDGQRGMTISTDRQMLSNDGRTLTVTDSGFGNVLDGLELNHIAAAIAGNVEVPFSLAGAAPEVQAFRACAEAPTA